MELVDTHCHLDEESFKHERRETLVRAAAAGVTRLITIGITLASSRQAIEIAAESEPVFAAVGIHPNYVSAAEPDDWPQICALAAQPKVVAVGETGLDRYWDHAPVELQKAYFQRHIELSRASGLPFIVHCREAEADVVACLREWSDGQPYCGVMHSFCGSQATLEAVLELGLSVSFGGMITFKKNRELRELAKLVPGDRLLVETDAPYLAPTPHRGKRNEPAYVAITLGCLADERQTSREELAAQTTANARRLFKMP